MNRNNFQLQLLSGVALLWLSMQLWFFYTGGIRPAGDSGRYTTAAEILLSGHLPMVGKAMSYLAYDAFIAVITGLGWGQTGVIVVQVLLSGFAAYTLYLLARHLYDWRAGVLAAFLFISFADLQKWNFYILTESLFISTLIFISYAVIVYSGRKRIITASLLLLIATLLRPNGIIVPLALSIYSLICLWQNGKRRLVAGIVALAVIVLSIASIWVGDMLSKEHIVDHYIDGTVIWGHAESALTMPGNVPLCATDKGNTFFDITCFVLAKPLYLIKLTVMKLFYFFLLARPYYSNTHNIIILLYLFPVYTLAIFAWYRGRREFIRWAFPAMIIFLQALVVSFTFADWDSRHLEVVLPLIIIFSSGGGVLLIEHLRKNDKTSDVL